MEKQTSVVFNGTPHGFSDECRCVPCRALRQATDAIVSEDVRIVYAEILSPDLAMPPGENAHSLLGDLPPFCRAHAENLVVNYGGVWAIKKIKIESNQEWHHLKPRKKALDPSQESAVTCKPESMFLNFPDCFLQ